MKLRLGSLALALLVVAASAFALPAESRTSEWVTTGGAPVAAGNPRDAKGSIREFRAPALRLFRTKAEKPLGTLLVLPGGGYVHLAVVAEGEKTAEFLNAQGFDAAVLEYTLAPGGKTSRDAALADARAAWALIRKDADALGLHPGRSGLVGYSAGGHLAARLVQSLPPEEQPDDLALVYPAYLDETRPGSVLPAVLPPVAPRRLFLEIARDDIAAWVKADEIYAKTWIGYGGEADWRILADGGHGYCFAGRAKGATKEWSKRLGEFLAAKPATRRANPALKPTPKLEEDGYDWYGRHEAIVREQKALDPDLVLVGDSITHAWGGLPTTGCPPNRRTGEAVAAAAFAGHRVLNCGFGYDRTQNVLWRLDHGELDGIRPKTVVIHIGTNNILPTKNAVACTAPEIAEGVLAVCDRVRAKCPDTKIVLMQIFPRWTPGHPGRAVIAEVNGLLAKATDARRKSGEKIVLRDLAPALLDDKGDFRPGVMSPDNTHPLAGGYEEWAKIVVEESK